jgi:probable rRNA maturation factor
VTKVEVTGAAIPRLPRHEIEAFTNRVIRAARTRRSTASIAFVDDAAMKRLNRDFRGRHKTTDVLTFPADDSWAEPGSTGQPLGDIVISIDQARRQARTEKHSLAIEIRYLILHGVLHALGYDHETDDGEMNALELKVRRKVGLE